MTTEHDHEVSETEVIDRPVSERRVERVERVREPGYVAPASQVNVNANPYAPVWTVTRVITLLFTVLEVLLLIRFALKLLGANPQQPLVAGLYGITEPLVRPFQGIWPQQNTPVVFDLPALLAIVFLFLIAALVVALVRAIAGNRAV
ncbi:MAG TPA: YggT family protein [Candidatus Limnocylindria bacterium]|nr:YggT family protein [Candidatus Limnocylindria bacterium]